MKIKHFIDKKVILLIWKSSIIGDLGGAKILAKMGLSGDIEKSKKSSIYAGLRRSKMSFDNKLITVA